jgi:hypothetical protein
MKPSIRLAIIALECNPTEYGIAYVAPEAIGLASLDEAIKFVRANLAPWAEMSTSKG